MAMTDGQYLHSVRKCGGISECQQCFNRLWGMAHRTPSVITPRWDSAFGVLSVAASVSAITYLGLHIVVAVFR